MSSELKACPFCGCKPSTTTYYIECDCAMEPRIDWFHVSRESAIANWNRRTPSPAVMALVEAVRGIRRCNSAEAHWLLDEALAGVEHEIGDHLRDASKKVEREIGGAP